MQQQVAGMNKIQKIKLKVQKKIDKEYQKFKEKTAKNEVN